MRRRTGFFLPAVTAIAAFFLTAVAPGPVSAAPAAARAQPKSGRPWLDMDYGPFLTASIEAPRPGTNLACKGIAIELGAAFGGAHQEAVIFDTDLLRYSAGWTGGFLDLKGVVFDGAHWAYPSIRGQQVFGNPPQPGWASHGRFADPREHPYGPLPRNWARWKGLYLHGQKVILSYTVAETAVLEMPALEQSGGTSAFSRTINFDPSAQDQILQIAFANDRTGQVFRLADLRPAVDPSPAQQAIAVLAPPARQANASSLQQDLLGWWEFDEPKGETAADQSGNQRLLTLRGATWDGQGRTGAALQFAGRQFAEIQGAEKFDFAMSDLSFATWIKTTQDGTIIAKTAPTAKWVPNGATWFVRGGRLTFDVGWVGAVASTAKVNDGRWHHVALTWSHENGRATLFIDGREDGAGNLKPKQPLSAHALRVGYTADNFPASTWLRGSLDGLRIYGRVLGPGEVAALAGREASSDILAVGLVGGSERARWITSKDGDVRLGLPANAEPVRMKILIWSGSEESLPAFAQLVKTASPPADLKPLTRGGPPRWEEKLVTKGRLGTNEGPYQIDTLTAPEDNPWQSWMRFGGVDFFADGKRAAISTWNGDVWIVSGVDGSLEHLTWQRIATGLFQPLGLKIVDDEIYVLGRDQITVLEDLNGDGETDFYRNFNNDCMVSEHFHEFATDLKLGPDGDFYYIKCACHALPAAHPHHGTLLRVARDGSKLEVVARGFRAVNGLGVGPNGEFTTIDNQGHWMPGNRLNWVQPGGWYGNQWAWNPSGRTNYDQPLCWMHNFVDRSGGTQLWVPTDQWGPLRNELITISYGMGHMFLVLKEPAGELMQGGVTRFPLEFETGVMRGVFHPHNQQLYTCGLYGWAGNKTKAGGFYRVRYTGQPLHMANRLHAASDGVVLGFTDPLDVLSATDPGSYDVKCWNYRWSAQYGSPDFKLDGKEGRDTLKVESATLSADRKRVFLKLPGIQPVMQMHIVFNLKAEDGTLVRNFVHNTIHQLGPTPGRQLLGADAIVQTGQAEPKLDHEVPGLIQTIWMPSPAKPAGPPAGSDALEMSVRDAGNLRCVDTRRVRLAALYVPQGALVTPLAGAGPFQAAFNGFLKLDLNDDVTFRLEGRGGARLRINGQLVLDAGANDLDGTSSQPVPLRGGLNAFELVYQSPAGGAAELRLWWSSPRTPSEPVPPTRFVHDAANPALREQNLVRQGRTLFASHQCAKCHRPDAAWPRHAMPELSADAPSLNDIGSRLNAAWMAQWIADPKSIRADALMPGIPTGDAATADAQDLATFLSSLRASNNPARSLNQSDPALLQAGEKLWAEQGCAACHLLPGDKPMEADARVGLGHVQAKWQPAALNAFLRAPTNHYQWTRMPDFKLSPPESAALAAYLLARAGNISGVPPSGGLQVPAAEAGTPNRALQSATEPATVSAPKGDAERGRELLATQGCLACHNLDGMKDTSVAPSLAALLQREWTGGCVTDDPSSRHQAPRFGFNPDERQALRRFARSDALASLQRGVPTEFAARQYTALRCSACHPRDQETDLLSSLQAAASASAEDESGEGGSVHIGRPPLTFAGEKLYAGWMERFVSGVLTYKPRAELPARMPSFPAYARDWAVGTAHEHGYPAEAAPAPDPDPQLAEIGQKLTAVGEGFSCVACHDVGSQKALAGKDTATVDFACVAERLRPTYYWRYVQDPPHVLSSTMMPKFIGDDGTTPIKAVYDGDPKRQFTAIWHYLMSLRKSAANKR